MIYSTMLTGKEFWQHAFNSQWIILLNDISDYNVWAQLFELEKTAQQFLDYQPNIAYNLDVFVPGMNTCRGQYNYRKELYWASKVY